MEGNETIAVDGASPNSTVAGTTVTLTDDDSYPAITLSANPSSVSEGASATSVTVTATAASAIASARKVTVSVGGSGTASRGTDYATVADFTVTIAANATSGTGTFTLTPTQDTTVEGSETVGVAGTSPSSTVTGTTVTLTDDDTHAITLSASPSSVSESKASETVTVTATINVGPHLGDGGDGVGGRIRRRGDVGHRLRGGVGLHGDDRGQRHQRHGHVHVQAEDRHGLRRLRERHDQRHDVGGRRDQYPRRERREHLDPRDGHLGVDPRLVQLSGGDAVGERRRASAKGTAPRR